MSTSQTGSCTGSGGGRRRRGGSSASPTMPALPTVNTPISKRSHGDLTSRVSPADKVDSKRPNTAAERPSNLSSSKSTMPTPHDNAASTLPTPPKTHQAAAPSPISWRASRGPLYREGQRSFWFKVSSQRMTHRADDFKPGTIIRALHYEEHYRQTPITAHSPASSERFPDFDKRIVSLKERVMLVVHCFGTHFVAVPVFTFSGRGLDGRCPAEKAQYMSIFDRRQPRANCINQTRNPPLMTERMIDSCHLIHGKAVVMFTYPISVSLKHKVCIEGFLTPDSTDHLLNYYYKHAGRPRMALTSELWEELDAREKLSREEFERKRQELKVTTSTQG